MARSEKSTPPMMTPRGGMITSSTKEDTILPNAAPMMMPTAMSTTLPRTAKALNSLMKLMGRLLDDDDDEDGYSASRERPPRYMKCDYCPLREFLMATRHYVAQAMVC